jgi:hypothetical protein
MDLSLQVAASLHRKPKASFAQVLHFAIPFTADVHFGITLLGTTAVTSKHQVNTWDKRSATLHDVTCPVFVKVLRNAEAAIPWTCAGDQTCQCMYLRAIPLKR